MIRIGTQKGCGDCQRSSEEEQRFRKATVVGSTPSAGSVTVNFSCVWVWHQLAFLEVVADAGVGDNISG